MNFAIGTNECGTLPAALKKSRLAFIPVGEADLWIDVWDSAWSQWGLSVTSNSRSLNCGGSYLAHFDIKTVTRHPSREEEGVKCGLVEVG
jgi:hypothetical protein